MLPATPWSWRTPEGQRNICLVDSDTEPILVPGAEVCWANGGLTLFMDICPTLDINGQANAEEFFVTCKDDLAAALDEIDRLEKWLAQEAVCEWESRPDCTCRACELKRRVLTKPERIPAN